LQVKTRNDVAKTVMMSLDTCFLLYSR